MASESHESHVTAETLDFDAVAKVSTRVTFRDIRLLWAGVGRFRDLDAIDSEWGESAFMGFDSHSEDIQRDDDGATFAVHASFVCRTDAEESDDNGRAELADREEESPPDVSIQAVFELIYELSDTEGIERSDLEHFAFVNGTHNAWPYWREYVHASTLRMGIPTYIVPPFKLPSSHDPDESAREDSEN